MRSKTRHSKRFFGIGAAGACASIVLFASMFAASAQATVYAVIGTGAYGLNVRTTPSLTAGLVTNLHDGTSINIVCQTRGDNVMGSTMWDKIEGPANGYLADYYTTTPVVNNPSPGLPTCGPAAPGIPEPPTTLEVPTTPEVPSTPEVPATTEGPRASAGGQQIHFSVAGQSCGGLSSVSIAGVNQYGQRVTWTGNSADGRSVFTRGWWWIGKVLVHFGRRTVSGYVERTHDVTDGQTAGTVTITCSGMRSFPIYKRFDNLGGKVFLLLNHNLAFDPRFHKYVSREYTFGYWDGHYVYEINNHVGIDINSGKVVVAQSTDHWIIFGGAVGAGRACLSGLSGAAGQPEIKAVIVSWCAAGGAVATYIH